MNENDEFLIYADDNEDSIKIDDNKTYIILVADDDIDVHNSTKLVLDHLIVNNRKLIIVDTYSGKETREYIENKTNHVDLLLLDAIMEDADAGLNTARYIREVLKLNIPTIVARSGFAEWENRFKIGEISFIDEFILKTSVTKDVLVNTVIKWLPKE